MKQNHIEQLERKGYIIIGRKRIRPNSIAWHIANVAEALALIAIIVIVWGLLWVV